MAELRESPNLGITLSVEDLVDPGAKALVQAYRMEIADLLPNFFKSLEVLDEGVIIDHDSPRTPLNIYAGYMKLFASGLAVCYEVVSRGGEINFPLGMRHFCTFDGESFSSFSIMYCFTLDNDYSTDYLLLALLYTAMLEKLEKERLSFLEKRLGINELPGV